MLENIGTINDELRRLQETTNYKVCISKAHQLHKIVKSKKYQAYMKYETEVLENLSLIDQSKSDKEQIVYKFGILSRFAEIDYKSLSLLEKIDLSIKLLKRVKKLHESGLIHYNISRQNICVTENRDVELIGYELSAEDGSSPKLQTLVILEDDNWNYIAPEQTGRINTYLNAKSDQYNIGVCLFELFTNNLPFRGKDKLELIHSHIAYSPPPVHKLHPDLPPFLSEVIGKLLAKSSNERYNNFEAVIKDFERLRDFCFGRNLKLPQYAGIDDIEITLKIPNKLYGRTNESEIFVDAYNSIKNEGLSVLALTGVSGVGKTAFIKEGINKILDEKLITVAGKFDQYQRNVPYLGIIQILKNLSSQLLLKSSSDIEALKELIAKNIGTNGKILTELAEELKFIVDDKYELAELGAKESMKRFTYTVSQFFKAIISQHPIILFVDDIQWADLSSVNLLKALVADLKDERLLLVFASRVEESEIFQSIKEDINKVKPLINIELEPLGKEMIIEMVRDILPKSPSIEVQRLSEIIQRNTEGNPYYIHEFINELISAKDNFNYHKDTGKWVINFAKIEESMATENVAEISLKKKDLLSSEINDKLAIASLLGNRFDAVVLSNLIGKDPKEVIDQLKKSVKMNIVVPLSDNYKYYDSESTEKIEYQFIHDRISQTYYNHFSEEEKKNWHLKIAYSLLENINITDPKVRLKAVNHANICIDEIKEKENALDFAQHNYEAALLAIENAAYDEAKNFLEFGLQYVGEEINKENKLIWLNIKLKLAQCYYASANYDECMTIVNSCLEYGTDRTYLHEAVLIKVHLYVVLGKYSEAIDLISASLRKSKIRFKKHPKQLDVMMGVMKSKMKLKSYSLEKLQKMKDLTDESKLEQLQLLSECFFPAYISRPLLFPILIFKVLELSMKYGNSPVSAFGYSCYSLLNSGIGDFDDARMYGEFTIELEEKYNYKPLNCSIEQNLVASYYPIFKGYNESIEKAGKAILLGNESGDTLFTGLLNLHRSAQLFFGGKNLNYVKKEVQKSIEVSSLSNETRSPLLQAILKLSNTLLQETQDENALMSWEEIQDHYKEINSMGDLCNTYLFEAIECILSGDIEFAVTLLDKIKASEDALMGVFYQNEFIFYYSVAHLLNPKSNKKALSSIKGYKKRLSKLAAINPENFQAKFLLIDTLLKKYHLKQNELHLLDQVLEYSKEKDDYLITAICSRVIFEAYESYGNHSLAGYYKKYSVQAFEKWGVKKGNHLFEDHLNSSEDESINATSNQNEDFDIKSILKASNMIFAELSVDKLVPSILKVAIENAGANNGLFITSVDNELYLKARSSSRTHKSIEAVNYPISSIKNEIPALIINKVIETRDHLILQNASQDFEFGRSSYVTTNNTKSVLCYPIVSNNEVKSIIYLENSLVEGAFSEIHLEIIKILSSQIRISLENAHLYQTMEKKVDMRTEEIRRQSEIIKKRNSDITDSIRYAKKIQRSLLPTHDKMESLLSGQFFVLYKPKDIIAGDFYWVDKKGDEVIFAAADCTGHGVPGAMVSVVCSNALNRATKEYLLSKPSDILNKVRGLVIENFNTSTYDDVKDGMDIALCNLNRKEMKLNYSGAHNELIIVRQKLFNTEGVNFVFEDDDKGLFHIKADRQSIGLSNKPKPFTNHTVDLMPNDMIYVFSDGFADQFGGPQNRKFLIKAFRKLLFDISQESLQDQHDVLNYRFEEWKGHNNQIDDVCVMAVRI
ncbi:AAA family ATPase [Flammeovirga agarivorans]|uniref:AAA family ATPase n=1 Tax=Flammeovirga agarivorans TaxID=2726742 RepID=A0A7X8SKS7_9BACT|nr:AAA family ATPase [Flammeovirga agarivorans]NLR91928.1 AAA family ATPase [Flammeovirga agarivorans]